MGGVCRWVEDGVGVQDALCGVHCVRAHRAGMLVPTRCMQIQRWRNEKLDTVFHAPHVTSVGAEESRPSWMERAWVGGVSYGDTNYSDASAKSCFTRLRRCTQRRRMQRLMHFFRGEDRGPANCHQRQKLRRRVLEIQLDCARLCWRPRVANAVLGLWRGLVDMHPRSRPKQHAILTPAPGCGNPSLPSTCCCMPFRTVAPWARTLRKERRLKQLVVVSAGSSACGAGGPDTAAFR